MISLAKKLFILFLLISIICACHNNPSPSHPVQVHIQGALKNIMKKGDLSAHADLSNLKDSSHFYALGPLENLKGEIIIIDHQPFISSVEGDKINIDQTFNHKAAMLVSSSVKRWKPMTISAEIKTYQDLEKHIEDRAKSAGFNPNQPFPFLINGQAESLDWHVIDWPDGDEEHSHEKHINSGLNGNLQNTEVTILGFFSKKHKAIFTHHTTFMHLHFKTSDNLLSGHVDDLVLAPGMQLSFPVQ